MIDLNSPEHCDKRFPTSYDILEKVSDYNIFKYYYKDFKVNALISSPFRKDKNPSCRIFLAPISGRLLFKDFGTNFTGDVFVFLEKYLNMDRHSVYDRVVVDFGLENYFRIHSDNLIKGKTPEIITQDSIKDLVQNSVNIQIKVREWNALDLGYWEGFNVSQETLIKYRVFPISFMFINGEIYSVDSFSYAYLEYKDGEARYKIYQPKSKRLKWVNNLIEGTLSGWEQMHDKSDYLIIASSLKDAMCIHDLGYTNVLAPQTENYTFKPHIVEALKERFKTIYVFYDNDEPGLKAAERMNILYGFKTITTKTKKYKDPSDFYKALGRDKLLECIKKQLNGT